MSVKTFTSRSTKTEILKAYNDLAKELKQQQKSGGSAPSEPGTHGTPDLIIACLAETLSPIRRIDSGVGPMKVKPLRSTRSANSAFSYAKP